MFGTALSTANAKWETLSFASTLYLYPILDTLLEYAPDTMRDDVRLGLQEALVNAAKHGNQLDPGKQICVRYGKLGEAYWWIITDQGRGFSVPQHCGINEQGYPDDPMDEGGRGLYILYQIFDEVRWHRGGQEVHLCKRLQRSMLRWPAFNVGQ